MADITLTTKQVSKIKRAIKALNDVRREIAHDNPTKDINWYLEDCDNLNLMEQKSHGESNTPNFNAVIDVFYLDSSSGGGW